jgi:hypothetical protein
VTETLDFPAISRLSSGIAVALGQSMRKLLLLAFAMSSAACTLAEGSSNESSAASPTVANGVDEVRDQAPEIEPWTILNRSEDLFAGLPQADWTTPLAEMDGGPTGDGVTGASLYIYDTPVKNQGSRPWCTAFATVAAMENIVRHTTKELVDLSEIDHWKSYQQYSVYSSVKAAAATLIVPETSYPYWGSPISNYRSTAVAKIASYKNLTTRAAVHEAIRAGHPVVIGTDLTASFRSVGSTGRVSSTGSIVGGHAMTVVGYQNDADYTGGGYLLIKNSWGSKWGDLGYARMPYDYCSKNRCYFLEIASVQYNGKTPSPSPEPDPAPVSDAPTADDIDVTAKHDDASPDRFKLYLTERKSGALAQVASVTYDVHETFGSNQYKTVSEATNGFETTWYRTYAHYWRTNGAVVRLSNGTTLKLAGAVIKW